MKPYIEAGVIIAACGSAIFWFMSAMCRFPGITPGMDELEQVNELHKALQKINNRNFWAAGLMGVTALLSAWIRFLG